MFAPLTPHPPPPLFHIFLNALRSDNRVDGTVRLDPAHAVQFLWIGIASCGNVLGALLALR